MAEQTKRPRYFDKQLLGAEDFTTEQSYQITRRRLHNRLLHTWGIARGLTLTFAAGATQATVTAGEAFDAAGREIVLAVDTPTPDVPNQPGATLFVTLAYAEVESDSRAMGGATGNARYTETPTIAVSPTAPGDPGVQLILGRLMLGADGKIANRDDGVDPVRRRLAGAVGGAGAIGSGTDLTVRNLSVTGNLGIGVPPATRLHVSGGAWDLSNTEGDLKVGDNNYRLKISVALGGGGAGDARIRAAGGTNRLMLGSGTTDTLTVTGARVGLGTLSPEAPFHVLGGNWDLSTTEGDIKLGDGTNRLKIGIALGGGGAGMAAIRVFGTWGGTGALTLGVGMNNNLFLTGTTVEVNGDLSVKGRLIAPNKVGFVVDHFVNCAAQGLEQGDVVVISGDASLFYGANDVVPIAQVALSETAYDTRVCGVVAELAAEVEPAAASQPPGHASARPNGLSTPADLTPPRARLLTEAEVTQHDRTRVQPGQIGGIVTLGAFAKCKVDADIAPIAVGDLLTSSPTPGYAQKVIDRERATGAILGKALASLSTGKGQIPVLVLVQ